MQEHLSQSLIAAIAKYGRHAKLVVYPNYSGYVTDSANNVVIQFATLPELYKKLNLGETK
jgi:S-methylmethionine-dependent homocysteine/selenocysteine methylase